MNSSIGLVVQEASLIDLAESWGKEAHHLRRTVHARMVFSRYADRSLSHHTVQLHSSLQILLAANFLRHAFGAVGSIGSPVQVCSVPTVDGRNPADIHTAVEQEGNDTARGSWACQGQATNVCSDCRNSADPDFA